MAISVENAFDMTWISVLDAPKKISKKKLMCVVAEAVLRAVQTPQVRAWSVPLYATHVNGVDHMPRGLATVRLCRRHTITRTFYFLS